MRPCKRVLIFFMAFNGVRFVFELCPNRVRIMQNNVRTDKRKDDWKERKDDWKERKNEQNERKKRNNVSMQTKKGGYGKIHLPHPLLLCKKTEER